MAKSDRQMVLSSANLETSEISKGELSFKISGRLDSSSVSDLWKRSMKIIDTNRPRLLLVDASGIEYCDGSGIGLFVEFVRRLNAIGGRVEIKNLKDEFGKLLDAFGQEKPFEITPEAVSKLNPIEGLGERFVNTLKELYEQISFMGELSYTLFKALLNPHNIRWKDVWYVVQRHGVSALAIVCIMNFLMGLIMAFQAAVTMRMFAAEVFVSNFVGLAMVRILGPLMTAVVLSGRTGSAFAAELGTMKINEEIDAIHTMGLNPMKFLSVSRVLGVLILMPFLVLFAELSGIIGGAVVMGSLGQSLITYFDRILYSVRLTDFFGGFVKSFVFAIAISSVGCLRGFKTKSGASAVGDSATDAVVNCLFLLIVIEGVFAVVYYFLGI
jgi:phospholipid/cholesterol/gamma-HCH transport system permease protein